MKRFFLRAQPHKYRTNKEVFSGFVFSLVNDHQVTIREIQYDPQLDWIQTISRTVHCEDCTFETNGEVAYPIVYARQLYLILKKTYDFIPSKMEEIYEKRHTPFPKEEKEDDELLPH